MSETSHPTSATAEQLRMLCKAVEKALGVEQLARSDFDTLQTQIFNRLHIHISATTLKRVWGYVATDSEEIKEVAEGFGAKVLMTSSSSMS